MKLIVQKNIETKNMRFLHILRLNIDKGLFSRNKFSSNFSQKHHD